MPARARNETPVPKRSITTSAYAIALQSTRHIGIRYAVPPTAGIVAKLFGVRYLATLFGMTLLTHQIGAFLGAWLGGVSIQTSGSLVWVWWVDIALAALAAVVNLPIREAKPEFGERGLGRVCEPRSTGWKA